MARRNIEKGDFVRAFFVVATRDLYGITGIPDADKIDALNDTPPVDIKARNDALR
jgi:tRNA (Thr-GGU) A37 N-methylase